MSAKEELRRYLHADGSINMGSLWQLASARDWLCEQIDRVDGENAELRRRVEALEKLTSNLKAYLERFGDVVIDDGK